MHLLGLIAGGRRLAGGGGPGGDAFKSFLLSSDAASSAVNISANSTTTFIDLVGGQRQRTTNEVRACLKITKAGKIRNLRCNVVTNGRITTTNIYLRVNSANSALVIPVSAGATGWQADDGTQEVTVAPGDLVCVGITTSTGNGNFAQRMLVVEYEADDGLVSYYVFNHNEDSVQTSATTVYGAAAGYGRGTIFGWASSLGDYATSRSSIGAAGTISDARVYVVTNTYDADAVFTLMKNGSATGIVVTVGVGVTGSVLETAPDTVTVADGDYLEWRCAATGRTTGNLGIGHIELTFLSSDGSFDVLGRIQDSQDPAINTSGVQTFCFPGTRLWTNTTESTRQMKIPFAATISKLRGYGSCAGTGAAQYDVFLRDGGSDTTVKFNVPTSANSNNLQKDTTNTHDVAAEDILTIGLTPLGSVSALYSLAYTVTPIAP